MRIKYTLPAAPPRHSHSNGGRSLPASVAKSLGREPLATESETLQLICQELKTARDVQNCFFPRQLRHVDGLDYYGECQPAGDIGGDFFDFVPLPKNRNLADVVGGRFRARNCRYHHVRVMRPCAGGQRFCGRKRRTAARRAGGSTGPSATSRSSSFLCHLVLWPNRSGPSAALVCERRARTCSAVPTAFRTTAPPPERVPGTVLGLTTREHLPGENDFLEPGDVIVAFTDGGHHRSRRSSWPRVSGRGRAPDSRTASARAPWN